MYTLQSFYALTIMLFLFVTQPAVAQVSPEVEQLFYRGYLTSSKTPWEQALKKIKNDASLTPSQRLMATTEAQAGLLIYTMASQDEATFDEVADDLEKNLETLLEQNEKNSHALARFAQLYGATISFSSYKAMYLGPQSQNLVDKALTYDPANAEAWVQRGTSALFTPAMFGGDVEEAVSCFQKAVQYFEEQSDTTRNWQYINALAWLGQALQQAGQTSEAVTVFNKALDVEPDFGWVKHQLLPQATAQTTSN